MSARKPVSQPIICLLYTSISGRTFAREMIALRQRETKRAGRILALQGQNPGQLELRTHSEFGANLSVTPGGFAFLWLRAIPRRSSPAGYHSLRLRPAKTKPQYLLLHPAMPNPRDERLIYTCLLYTSNGIGRRCQADI